ncbi:MAG TPA: apolipoprotein N-acyltransferase [Candidatus Omnitrophota bacterium]|nr:apolipoprotein N-acyltransferase [Candidatus Omnitrophota bacterium]
MRAPLAAAASGILASLAFPSASLWPLIFVALVPLLLVLASGSPGPGDPEPASRGVRWAPWLMGTVFYALTFWWIVRLPVAAMTHPWLIYPGLLALGLYLGLYVALFGWLVRFVRRRLGWPVLALAPFAWGVAEWLKSSGELGCPWGNLGTALAEHPAWIQGASLAGAPGLSFWVVTVNALVAAILLARRWSSRIGLAMILAAAVGVPVVWGTARLQAPAPAPLVRVAIVQPNVGSHEKWVPALQDSVTARVERLTREAGMAEPRATVILWPETALPYYVRVEPLKLQRLIALAKEVNRPILAGYPDAKLNAQGDVLTYNAAGLVLPAGAIVGQYEKIHLVPFGERIPFQGLFPFLGSIDLGQAEWTPGTRPYVFRRAGPAFGVLICFESIFPDHTRRYALEGAQYLVNITNDEWFGRTAGPIQHADLAILRSVELGMGVARAANTGVSMLIDPYGRVEARTPLFAEAVLVGTVKTGIGPTPFARWGDWVSMLSLAVTLILVAVAWFRGVDSRSKLR